MSENNEEVVMEVDVSEDFDLASEYVDENYNYGDALPLDEEIDIEL